jgi:hypothetical protein
MPTDINVTSAMAGAIAGFAVIMALLEVPMLRRLVIAAIAAGLVWLYAQGGEAAILACAFEIVHRVQAERSFFIGAGVAKLATLVVRSGRGRGV